jgi:hypothetical protein
MHFIHLKDDLRRNIMECAQTDYRFRNYSLSSHMMQSGTPQFMAQPGQILHQANFGTIGQGLGPGHFGSQTPSPFGYGPFGGMVGDTGNFVGELHKLEILSSGPGSGPTEDLIQRFEQGLEVIKLW